MHRRAADIIWDNHVYLPPVPGNFAISEIERHRRAGFNVAFLNLGDANRSLEHVVRMAAFFRRWIKANPDRFILLETIRDVERARDEGKLAIGFNVEGLFPVGDQLDAISLLYDLGVRWMLFVYNRRNLAGSGVHDPEDAGLTPFGRAAAAEMDRVGMIKCLTHTGYRTAMDVLTGSSRPCIFSHSNARALKDHARNIPDELIRACAVTGGVVGINGISIFLGDRADAALMVEHIDYVVQLVGIDHVAIGSDYGYIGTAAISDSLSDLSYWPAGNQYDKVIECVPPEQIETIAEGLAGKGYDDDAIAKVLGRNMLRIATAVWR